MSSPRNIHVPRARSPRGSSPAGQSVARAVGQFAVTGLAAVVLLGFVAVQVLEHTGQTEAIRDAKNETKLAGEGVVAPQIRAGLLRGDPAASARLDRIVREHVLRDPVVRVKIWDAHGTIVYSDKRELIGSAYRLRPDEMAALRSGGVDVELSDLSRPENRFERSQHKLLEVYLGIRGPGGVRLLYEDYLSYRSVAASAKRLWSQFAPGLFVTLVLLELAQIPLALSLARRLRRGQNEREILLRRAVEASEVERRRIARDLHDGAVQSLLGVSYGLSAAAARLRTEPAVSDEADSVERAAKATRESIRELRTLLVEIYPPALQRAGLRAALLDLVTPLQARGILVELEVDPELEIPPQTEPVLYRVAQEAVRNIASHAQANRASIRVRAMGSAIVLSVEDDGRGFVPTPSRRAEDKRHFGLRILNDLAEDVGGELLVQSQPGAGTTVQIDVPRT